MFRIQLFFLIIIIIIISIVLSNNKKNKTNDIIKVNKYSSLINNAINQFIRLIVIDFIRSNIVSHITLKKIISIKHFENTIIGKGLVGTISYLFYLYVIYPHLSNILKMILQ